MKRNDLEVNLVKKWGSPRSNVQLFVPQECVAACEKRVAGWKAYGNMMLSGTIYHDTDGDYQHDRNEDVAAASGNVPANASSNNDENYIHSLNLPTDISEVDGYWYEYHLNILIADPYIRASILQPLYNYGSYYFTRYEIVRTAS